MTKRFITAISVACVLFLCFSVTASAKTDKNNLLDDYEDQLVSQLDFLSRDIENSKLSDIDFRELYIGNPISIFHCFRFFTLANWYSWQHWCMTKMVTEFNCQIVL